jgi:cobalt-zinc-cadmium efflux system protein
MAKHFHNHSHHSHSHAHSHHHGDVKNIKVAFFLNFGFTIFEIAGGLFTNSVAILSDAVHDLGDSLSLALAWYFQKISKKGRNASFSYGYKRFSLLGALVNAIVLTVGGVYVLAEAVPRLFEPEAPKAGGMFAMAVIGILVNGAAALRLKKGSSINERVVSLHLLEDVLGWIAILIGSAVMFFVDFPIIDPIMSIGISCFILFNVFKNIKQSLVILLQGVPLSVDADEIGKLLTGFPKISGIHDLHIWSVDGEYNILTVHLVTDKSCSQQELLDLKPEIRQLLKLHGIHHSTLEVEISDNGCEMENCDC